MINRRGPSRVYRVEVWQKPNSGTSRPFLIKETILQRFTSSSSVPRFYSRFYRRLRAGVNVSTKAWLGRSIATGSSSVNRSATNASQIKLGTFMETRLTDSFEETRRRKELRNLIYRCHASVSRFLNKATRTTGSSGRQFLQDLYYSVATFLSPCPYRCSDRGGRVILQSHRTPLYVSAVRQIGGCEILHPPQPPPTEVIGYRNLVTLCWLEGSYKTSR